MTANLFRSFVIRLSCLCIGLIGHPASRADTDELWDIVTDKCLPGYKAGSPWPCLAVRLERGTARGDVILKDKRGKLQYLLIPTARITGIESSNLLTPDSTNYWQDAWVARRFMSASYGDEIPRGAIALTINSKNARGQNQLHIHISCVDSDVGSRLKADQDLIGPDWTPLRSEFKGTRYFARRLVGDDLSGVNPFQLVSLGIPGAAADMGDWTIAVVAIRFQDTGNGFIILAAQGHHQPGKASAENDIQDHSCKILE